MHVRNYSDPENFSRLGMRDEMREAGIKAILLAEDCHPYRPATLPSTDYGGCPGGLSRRFRLARDRRQRYYLPAGTHNPCYRRFVCQTRRPEN